MRKTAGLIAAALIVFSSICGFATEPELIIEEANYYTAELCYCDADRGKIVITNVKPTGEESMGKTKTATDAEYSEIDVYGNGRFPDGVEIEQEEFNRYADSKVKVLIIRNASGGLRVVALRFI